MRRRREDHGRGTGTVESTSGIGAAKSGHVQTLDGVVYLTGQVAADLQRHTAESATREATGVSPVINTIALTYAGR
jgi:osmotically-inducible protein OsmY